MILKKIFLIYLFNNKGSAYYDIKEDIFSLLKLNKIKIEKSNESEHKYLFLKKNNLKL